MQSSSIRRQMKNMVNNYTDAEVKVREATSNDPWGPSSSLMAEIAELTYNVVAYTEVMGIIWKRLNDHGKNWRHVYKALTLLDYLVKSGSERVAKACRENIFAIQTLKDFQYIDRDGHDQGLNIRERSKKLVLLLKDEEKLKKERSQSSKSKSRFGRGQSGHPAHHSGDGLGRERGSASYSMSPPSSHIDPDLQQAIPLSTGEEELQLQLALAMSREESEKPPPRVHYDEKTQLQMALNSSKKESLRVKPVKRAPAPAAALDMDEDEQLRLALSLSKEEHKQEQRSRRGDETEFLRALEESKREMEGKGGTAFMDLVDVFAVPPDLPPSGNRRNHTAGTNARGTDSWDSLDNTNIQRADSPWMVPPSSNTPPPPWEPPAYPWDEQINNPSKPTSQDWTVPANTASSAAESFSVPSERTATSEHSVRGKKSPDGNLFDDAMDGGSPIMNGRGGASPDHFDLSSLGENLSNTRPGTHYTPEAFLGATGASLVNLDTLIPTNTPAKTTNPFLSAGSVPSAANPFQLEEPKPSMNQISTSFTSAGPPTSSLPYSASLPLPVSHQGATLPSSVTHPSAPGLGLPLRMPEPLLPFSSASNEDPQINQNPFL